MTAAARTNDRPHRPAGPCIMVIFGAAGDLTKRKLLPALVNLHRSGLLGDVNGDDRVTAADEKRLRRYLAGAKVAIETGNADMNGDGTIDLVDLMLLQKSLSK